MEKAGMTERRQGRWENPCASGRTSMGKHTGGGQKGLATRKRAAGQHAWLGKPRSLQSRLLPSLQSYFLRGCAHTGMSSLCRPMFVCCPLCLQVLVKALFSPSFSKHGWLNLCSVFTPLENMLSISTDWAQKPGSAAASHRAD